MESVGFRRLWERLQGSSNGAVRTVEVVSPSRADELGWVLLAAGFVILGVIYAYGFEREAARVHAGPQGAGSGLLPYQVLFRDLPSVEQRLLREMQEGALEAVRLRAETGRWPSAESLAADGVPPFARDVLDKTGLQWSAENEGLFVNYRGTPAPAAGMPALLLMVQEPDPVTGEKPPPPSVVDEEHQVLADGTLLHVTYWKRSLNGLTAGLVVDPALAGWQQIRVKTPLEELEEMDAQR